MARPAPAGTGVLGSMLRGGVAGALGTLALNATTYADVAVRGRPPSDVPEEVVRRTAETHGLPLSRSGSDAAAAHRRTGLAALSGYATGIFGGVVFGAVRPRLPTVPLPLAGLLLGGAIMAVTDTTATVVGATDPRRWGSKGWLADIGPHAVYGLATASAFDRLRLAGRRRR